MHDQMVMIMARMWCCTQVRAGSVALLQRVVVGGEGLSISGDYLFEALAHKALPLMGDLLKMGGSGGRGGGAQEVSLGHASHRGCPPDIC